MGATRDFLFERVYLRQISPTSRQAVERIIETLLEHFATHPVHDTAEEGADPRVRAVDYVAGMTDRFAIRTFEDLVEGAAGGIPALV